MLYLTQFSRTAQDNDTIPLPILIAKHWRFSLDSIIIENETYYSVEDWLFGVLAVNHHIVNYCFHDLLKHLKQGIVDYKYPPTPNEKYKAHQRPFLNKYDLVVVLAFLHVNSRFSRLIDVRNYVANLYPEYNGLRCKGDYGYAKRTREQEFQIRMVEALKLCTSLEIRQSYILRSGRIIDIALLEQTTHCSSEKPYENVRLIIECKINHEDLFKAIGQIACYNAEVKRHSGDIFRNGTVLAMPPDSFNDYMREVGTVLGIHLWTEIDGVLIDVKTGEHIESV